MKQKRPRIVAFTIITTATVLVWAGFEVTRSFTNPIPTQVDPTVLEPLTPSLDAQALQDIKSRLFFTDEQARTLNAQPATNSANPAPIAPQVQGATSSASPVPTISPTP